MSARLEVCQRAPVMRGFVGQTRSTDLVARLTELGVGEATQPWEFPPRRSPWFLDNGAFTFWRRGVPFDHKGFRRAVELACGHPTEPEWITVPDVVADAEATIALAREYLPILKNLRFRCAIVVQDGMTPATFPLWGAADVIFVGGSLVWKLGAAGDWCSAARAQGLRCHIGRVGSARRVRWAQSIQADSVDSCVPLFSEGNLRVWSGALASPIQQLQLGGWLPPPARERAA